MPFIICLTPSDHLHLSTLRVLRYEKSGMQDGMNCHSSSSTNIQWHSHEPIKASKTFPHPWPAPLIFSPDKNCPRIVMPYSTQTSTYSCFLNQLTSATFTGSTQDVIRQRVCTPKSWFQASQVSKCPNESSYLQFMQQLQHDNKEENADFLPEEPPGYSSACLTM